MKFLIEGTQEKIVTDSRTGKTLFQFDKEGKYITNSLYIAGLCSRKFKVIELKEESLETPKQNVGDEVIFEYEGARYRSTIVSFEEDGTPVFDKAEKIEEEPENEDNEETQEQEEQETETEKTESENEENLESKGINELRKIAKELGLDAQGTKEQLIARIQGE